MHIFATTLTAGATHAFYREGEAVPAVCMVDSRDHDEAIGLAVARLGELGWREAQFKSSVLLAVDPDTSSFTDVMREAYADARRLKVSVIEYPEPTHAA
jgi:hypothetical protein